MMNEYLFDAKLFVAVRIKAETAKQARRKLEEQLHCATINLGAIDGKEVVCEGSLDGDADLMEVNGEAI